MADLVIDGARLADVAGHTRRASAEFTSAPDLHSQTADVFGSPVVSDAFAVCAATHDQMVRTLDEDASVLVKYVTETGSAMAASDAALARAVR